MTTVVSGQIQCASAAGTAVNVKPDCVRAVCKRHRYVVPQTVIGNCARGVNFSNPEAAKCQGVIAAIDEELLATVGPGATRSFGQNVVFDPGCLSLDPGNY